MNDALGQFGGLGQMANSLTDSPATNPLVNPSSMQPSAMSNMMGSPLANGGANMGPYLQMQEAFTPKPLQQGTSSPSTYNTGGLVSFADGGMPPPPQEAAPGGGGLPPPDPAAGGGMPPQAPQAPQGPQGGLAQAGGGDPGQGGGPDPQLVAQIEQIFSQNVQDPKKIADELLKLVMHEIEKVISPQEREHLHSPQGQQELQQIVQQLMESMKGGLGQMAGGGGSEGGAPAPGGPPPAPGGGLAGAGA